jgi:vacuolar-type H+-ATPase subunit E/Vma4
MQNINEIFLYMKDEIERAAKSEENAILKEVEELQSQAASEISESHVERTKKLIEKRDEYVSIVFKEAKDKLIAFTNSDKYKEFMTLKAQKIIDEFKGNDFILYVNQKDLALKSDLMKLSSDIKDVKENADIMIGGLIGENPKSLLVIDETLDFALKNQKDWFSKNSGLIIK